MSATSSLAVVIGTRAKPFLPDVPALGTVCPAGLKAGVYKSIGQLTALNKEKTDYQPRAHVKEVNNYYAGWERGIKGTIA